MKKLASLSLAAAVLSMTAGCSMLPQATPAHTVTVTATASLDASPTAAGVDTTESSTLSSEPAKSRDESGLSKTIWDYQDGQVSDESFVATVRANTTTLDPYGNEMMIVLTQNLCASVANGTTRDEIIDHQEELAKSVQTGEPTKEMGRDVAYLVVTGAENYCPELSDDLMDILQG
ncbi:hypothetical protein FBY31_0593 [Arthrobacter sp. SLBN-100]|uniref:DUF732 domain-containing protein n=1 Tax=Arthrobacter sp. SLBN-100 TaxID=2768450 RepID=UPI0011509EB5|nr:DUF732 domain-containing protein [Arthrobacter sp. SLBN-100]TQJ66559.1 hypothetical protein FBY31_0593 [Arthrobacter sp. SLBN-100]